MGKKGPVFVNLKVTHPGEPPEVRLRNIGPEMKRLAAKLSEQ